MALGVNFSSQLVVTTLVKGLVKAQPHISYRQIKFSVIADSLVAKGS
jgi:hypothetical protein